MDGNQKQLCPGCKCCECKGGFGFQKLLESKQGVVVYGNQNVIDKKDVNKSEGMFDDAPSLRGSKEVQTKSNVVIVIQNTKDNDITSEDFLPEIDLNEVSCPRCRHVMARAKALLKNVPVVGKNNIRCVCELCELKRQARAPCLHCLNAIKKFKLSGFVDSRKDEVLKHQIMTFLKNAFEMSAIDNLTRDLRAYSDVDLADTVKQRSKHIQHLERPKSSLVLDSTFKFVSDKGLTGKLQKHFDEKKVKIASPTKVGSVPKKYEQEDIDFRNEIIRGPLEPILKPEKVLGREKKAPYHSRDEALSLKSETVLGLGTTGIMRRYHSEESLTSFSAIKEETIKNTFKYFFPRIIKKEKEMYKTSEELIKDTRERFQAEIIEKIRKQEELQKIQEQKAQEKIILEEEIKQKVEWAKQRGINRSDIDVKTGKILQRHGLLETDGDFKIHGGKDKKEKEIKKDKRGKIMYQDGAMSKDKEDILRKGKADDLGKGKGKPGKITETKEGRGIEQGKTLKEKREKGAVEKKEKSFIEGKEKVAKDKGERTEKGFKGNIRKEKEHKYNFTELEKGDKKGGTKVAMEKNKGEKIAGAKVITSGKEVVQKQQIENKESNIKGTQKHVRGAADQVSVERSRAADGMGAKIGGTVPSSKTGQAGSVLDKSDDKADKTAGTSDKAAGKQREGTKDEKDTKISQDDIHMQDDIKLASEIKFQKIASHDTKEAKDKTDHKKPGTASSKNGKDTSTPFGNTSADQKVGAGITQDEVNLLNKVIKKQEKAVAIGNKSKKDQEDKLKSIKQMAAKTANQLQPAVSLDYLDILDTKEKVSQSVATGKDKKTQVDKRAVNVPIGNIQMQISGDDLILKMVKMRSEREEKPKTVVTLDPLPPVPPKKKIIQPVEVSRDSDIQSDADSLLRRRTVVTKEPEVVYGGEVMFMKDIPPDELKAAPVLFHSEYKGDDVLNEAIGSPTETETIKQSTGGSFRYALSDRKYINNGWTILPTEKIVRKVNVYRMHPAQPEFDWFEHNKKKGTLQYSTGEKLAEVDKDGRGRWYYKNGRLALDYYDCEENNAHQRYVIYSSGEQDDRGRSTPITVLGMFDYNGNGVVFDHAGKIRLKYNQNEGVVLDRSVGPVSHWKWHSLNDPPELQQVMIDNQLDYKDPEIFAFDDDKPAQEEDETMLAIEYNNYTKSKQNCMKAFEPHQINMKTMKMNDQFTLKIIDQRKIYLLFRDGGTTMKCNLGLKIDHSEMVDTGFCELGEVELNVEKLPAATDSIADLQKKLKEAQRVNQVRVARELKTRPLAPAASADRLITAVTRPLRRPLQTEDPAHCKYRVPANNIYYNTRLI